jgi:outer membrane receptor protein involved in Fe transport
MYKIEMTKTEFFLFIIFIFISNNIYSQVSIRGQVVNQNNKPIEFIEVYLQNIDSTITKSELTTADGKFTIITEKEECLLFLVQVGLTVYKQKINPNQDLNLGIFPIIEREEQLNEVVVSTKKKLIERKIDRLIFNVANSTAVTGGTALDALKFTPRIKVENDQISMIGKGGMLVMVNDRIIQLSGDDLANYLKTLHAEDLKLIEVITNPPAKYSAEGNSGIINIVTKNSKSEAWNASIRSVYQQATYAMGNTGGSFNMQKGKFDLTSNINYANGSTAAVETSQILYPNSTWNSANNRRDYMNNLSARFGLTYKINDKIKTGFNFNHLNSKPLSLDDAASKIYNISNNQLDSIIATKASNEYEIKLTSLNYYLQYEIDSIGKKLALDIDYFDYYDTTNRLFNTQSYFSNTTAKPNAFVEARNYGEQNIKNYSLNLNMDHPTRWIDINYGLRISRTTTRNIFDFFLIENNTEIKDLTQSNEFDYQENIQAAYFSGKKSLGDQWEAKLGLRYEWTQTEGFTKTLNQINTNNYQKLFPTFYLAYKPNDKHSFNLNYGKRIQRPTYENLNPFRYVSNPYSFSEGNPFLKPAFTDNLEIEYSFKDYLITNVYYSYTDDNFQQVTILDETTNIRQIMPQNFIINRLFGVNQTFIYKPIGGWDINVSANVYYSSTDSKITQTLPFLKGWNGEFSMSNDFVLNENKTLLASLNYNFKTRGVSNLYTNSFSNQLNSSIKWLLLDKKMTVSLYLNDVFSSNRTTYKAFSNNIEFSFRNYYDARFFRLGVVYNWGKTNKANQNTSKNQEEQDRL